MCGIAGIAKLSGSNSFDWKQIASMTDALKHRGPDGEGFAFFSENEMIAVGGKDTPAAIFNSDFPYSPPAHLSELTAPNSKLIFGHRRLSIIDLSPAGHQPMCSGDKNTWITYNGEIYNYIELREELKSKGHQFFTGTDTEVILAAYAEWGFDCVSKFNGMWALVIFDRGKNIIFGSRDRFGVKPLYYFRNQNYFAFASEQKALLQLPFVKKEINPLAVFDFLALNKLESEEEGFFKNIFELLPSHSFTLNLNDLSFRKWRYYTLPVNLAFENFSPDKFNTYTREIRQLVEQAISLRLRSDVTVGSCLSGGLDSSTIVCIINDLLKKNPQYATQIGERQKVFTASFKNEKIDESSWAKMVIEQTSTSWQQVFPNENDFLKEIENLHYSQDIPLISTSTFAQYNVMKLAKENGIKVLLDGQGGDELFAGYANYFPAYWNELLRHFQWGKLANETGSFEMLSNGWSFFIRQNLKNKLIEPSSFLFRNTHREIRYLHPDLWNEYRHRIKSQSRKNFNSLNESLAADFDNAQLKNYLKCEDRSSMHFSIESRTPFADDIRLIEYLFQIPSSYKIRNSVSKYLLRESCKDILPEKIRNRKDKMGYVTPNNEWLRKTKNKMRDYFTPELKDYLNMDLLLKEYDDFFNPATDTENYRIFKFISFTVWHKVFNS